MTINIPKEFLNAIEIPGGTFGGQLASPCLCGYPIDISDDDVSLIRWPDGKMMFCHNACLPEDEDA